MFLNYVGWDLWHATKNIIRYTRAYFTCNRIRRDFLLQGSVKGYIIQVTQVQGQTTKKHHILFLTSSKPSAKQASQTTKKYIWALSTPGPLCPLVNYSYFVFFPLFYISHFCKNSEYLLLNNALFRNLLWDLTTFGAQDSWQILEDLAYKTAKTSAKYMHLF